MRRLLAIVLMFFLPFQWSWSAAASVCEHEANATHFGHHVHVHDGADASAHAEVGSPDQAPDHDPDKGKTNAGYHADCHTCHLSIACLGSLASDRHLWPVDAPLAVPSDRLPDPPIEALFRPPLVRPASIG